MTIHRQRRPVWKPSARARVLGNIGRVLKQITLKRALVVVLGLPALIYLYREVTRDSLIIDPFGVPKSFTESGLTGEVIANHIGDVMRQIETSAQTEMSKDRLTVLRDEGSMPDVEIPGTKLGLKTLVEITRAIFARHPKHVGGDIIIAAPPAADPAKVDAHVTFYVTQGRDRSQAISLTAPATDVDSLTQPIAEKILEQVNPYILAEWKYDRHEFDRASEIFQHLIQDPSQDRLHVEAACVLWGNMLSDQGKYDEAIAKYQKAIELDPKSVVAHYDWGISLDAQGKYDEAITKYQKTIELDPKYAGAYHNWGHALNAQGKYNEAIAKYQKTVQLDPKYTLAYNNWGISVGAQGKYDEAIAKYQKAIELDPKYAFAYNNWGVALHNQGKHDEAITKYRKAIEFDPKYATAYRNLGNTLDSLGRHAEAEEKFAKARELSPPK